VPVLLAAQLFNLLVIAVNAITQCIVCFR
jgi:hypothetical protein